ncbi:hypothetical protein [Streptomyces poonensis]|uniref:Integral membrane protein n=1 Tax=Streptomyces poonensis TaxID=68255 RepID=A0A918PD91_9ACTN|nr:hypothetical protein [Streptomyces poonensis]GGZ00670.1 hypothetical protein GCM10010365_19340 [Streptomyces poonensis]GLJ93710.1 hypothetical protein GCM10017589_63260 [Streptomyces poonensis]
MVSSSNVTVAEARRPGPVTVTGTSWRERGEGWLWGVAGAFTAAQLALVRPGTGLGWDESVYVSQVSPDAPAAFFSAPRARGVSWLVAPIASWSSSTPLLRIYLAVLSGLALYLALRAWRGLFPARVLAGAGALFATLWVTLFYGPQAMPNYWVAIGALVCVGCFLRAQAHRGARADRTARADGGERAEDGERADHAAVADRGHRAALWGAGAGAALMAVMRPTDAVWVTLPLLAVLVCVRRRWHPRLLAALLAGLTAGAAPWVIEAYTAYGGLRQRLSDGSRVQGGLGWNIAVDDQLRSLGGRTLCRPCTGGPADLTVTFWWYLLPVLAVLGLVVAVRARRAEVTLIPLACAATAAVPYLFLIGYAAPRFLLPAYALLFLVAADALAHLVTAPGRTWRPVAVTLVALVLAGHLVAQYAVLERTVERTTASRENWTRTAAELHRLGVRPPCLVTGHQAIPVGFYARCASGNTRGNNANTTRGEILRTAERVPVVALTAPGAAPPAYARDWPTHRFGGFDFHLAPAGLRDGR